MCLYGAKCCFEVHVICLHGSDVVKMYREGARRVCVCGGGDGDGGARWWDGVGRGREGRTGLGRVGGVGVSGAWSVVARPLLSCSGVTMPCDQPARSALHQNGFPSLQRLE